MKNHEIKATATILQKVNVAKLADKELRKSIFNAYLAIVKADKAFDADMELAQKKAFEGMDMNAHNELVGKIQSAEREGKHDEAVKLTKKIDPKIVKAIADFNDFYADHLKADTEVKIEQIDTESFLDAMNEQGFDLTIAELDTLTKTILK